jgi:DNA excision repair protein ERCC-4
VSLRQIPGESTFRLPACHSFAANPSTTGTAPTATSVETIQLDDVGFDTNYGLRPPEQTVIIRAYSDDTDDQVLAEIRPRYIVMYEPNQDFIRRIEVISGNIIMPLSFRSLDLQVYRNANPGLGVRLYFLFYATSCEEHKYLAGLRREKESFERLIKERGVG